MIKKSFNFTVCVLALFFGAINFYFAQKPDMEIENKKLGDMQLENVKIKEQNIESVFTSLSLKYNIPMGLEIGVNDNELTTYSLDFKKGTLSDLLTQFVKENNQYKWQIHNGVVYIFPSENYRDVLLIELLDTKISNFSINKKTSCFNMVESLVNTPEIKKVIKAKGLTLHPFDLSGFYIPQLGRDFTLSVSNLNLKSVMDTIVKESPIAKIWIIKKYNRNQNFFIRFKAKPEDSANENWEFDFQ